MYKILINNEVVESFDNVEDYTYMFEIYLNSGLEFTWSEPKVIE